MTLKYVQEGIYALDGHNLDNSDVPVVIVHPFYAQMRPDPKLIVPENYLENLKKLVQSHEGPIITLEGSFIFGRTIMEYGNWGNIRDRYFIMTADHGPAPKEATDKDMINFIKSFKGRPIRLAGGYLLARNQEAGCLGQVLQVLHAEDINLELIDELVCTY
ncbi:hypothetical protein KY308_03035 [Candidatus Woesearchaeota archaeon]|nr:hypothetical protein [Candidatus Woesearchaeota archaeon]